MPIGFIDEESKQRVLAALEKNPDKAIVSRALHVSVDFITAVEIAHYQLYNYTTDGMGPEHLKKFIVARRSVFDGAGWDNKSLPIRSAREKYTRGEAELTTGRDGEFLILYSIPRKKKETRDQNYFKTEEAT